MCVRTQDKRNLSETAFDTEQRKSIISGEKARTIVMIKQSAKFQSKIQIEFTKDYIIETVHVVHVWKSIQTIKENPEIKKKKKDTRSALVRRQCLPV